MIGFTALCALVVFVGAVVPLRTESRTFRQLQRNISVAEEPTAIEQIVGRVERETGVEVRVDWKALEPRSIEPDTTLEIKAAGNMPAHAALFMLHHGTGGSWDTPSAEIAW
jgi:hypothetical protein